MSMSWQERVFKNFKLYAVTDLDRPDALILKKVEAAYRGGADIVQLRSKCLPDAEKIKLGLAIRKIATRLKKLYFMNDSLDLALLTNADGLHVGQDDVSPRAIRFLCGKYKKKLFLGLSTHNEDQLKRALREPVDYFAVGPVFKTPTKPTYGSVGLKLVQRAARLANKPWLAIGGVSETNIERVVACGASRVAVVRAVFNAKQTGDACRRLIMKLKG